MAAGRGGGGRGGGGEGGWWPRGCETESVAFDTCKGVGRRGASLRCLGSTSFSVPLPIATVPCHAPGRAGRAGLATQAQQGDARGGGSRGEMGGRIRPRRLDRQGSRLVILPSHPARHLRGGEGLARVRLRPKFSVRAPPGPPPPPHPGARPERLPAAHRPESRGSRAFARPRGSLAQARGHENRSTTRRIASS